MTQKFEHVDNGEWIEVTPREKLSFACCDCALVHELDVAIEDDGTIFISFTRNQRKTGAMRRHHGVPAMEYLKENYDKEG